MAKNISLEQSLEDERKEILALLSDPPTAGRQRGSSLTGGSGRTQTPLSTPPVRSMLDIDLTARTSSPSRNKPSPATPPPIRSMLDIDSPPPVRSMLDVGDSSSPAPALSMSAQTSPVQTSHQAYASNNAHNRSFSDASAKPAGFGPRAAPASDYRFSGFFSSNSGAASAPKRNNRGGKKALPSAMAGALRGELSSFGPKDKGKSRSTSLTGLISGGSPRTRRSSSPRPVKASPDSNKILLEDGTLVDPSNAYRRLSDANLLMSRGGLSSITRRSRSRKQGNSQDPENARLEKDYLLPDGEEALVSSDEESSGEEPRGRKQEDEMDDDEKSSQFSPRSLMAAAEEERKHVAANHKYRSLIEPEGPKGKASVHPNTSFDQAASGFNTPEDSDDEAGITDIKRAQRLSMTMTPVISTPATSRCVRTLYRGDFAQMQEEASEHHRRIRKYLVATDLSDEAAHALEWTIGTVLRDGDTLLAIYCVDEDIGIADPSGEDVSMREQAVAIAASARPSSATPTHAASSGPSPFASTVRLDSTNPSANVSASPMGRERNKAEHERYRAVQDITDRVSKLLRKTKLQVKVVIEVIHCKSPKHLITEVIDFINPTMVILGSRGRSALKGVILGSFSNYLVTKSSVPVMVARKRLKKHTKYKRPAVRLANNLPHPNPKTLAHAIID